MELTQVHGHELINLIIAQNKPISIAEVKELAETKIGKQVVYHTCSASGMDTDQMISFLLEKNKLVERKGGYVIDTGEVCDHDEDREHTH